MKATLSALRSDYHLRIAAWTTISFTLLMTVLAIADDFDVLVSDRTSVERVYHNHRLGTKPSFEQALPAAEVEGLVKADLHKEALLAKVYHVGATKLQIEADMERIDLETRAPEILAEIKAALGDDPARFARAVAKPIVVDRELRRRFENDDRLHGAQRRQAESAREQLLAAQRKENPWPAVLKTIKQCTEWTVSDVTWQLGQLPEAAQSPNRPTSVALPLAVRARSSHYAIDATAQFAQSLSPVEGVYEPADKSWIENLSTELRNLLRAQLQKPGAVSAVIETPNSFLLFVAKERAEQSLSATALSVSKLSFEQWLSEQKE